MAMWIQGFPNFT